MKVVIIQPPLLQFNAPYPSGAYLKGFFNLLKQENNSNLLPIDNIEWHELNNAFFHELFSSQGLKKLFDKTQEKALKIAQNAQDNGDEITSFNIRRYISQQDAWICWINIIKAVLCGSSNFNAHEAIHQFVRNPYVPRGERMINFLDSIGETFGEISVDNAKILATFALADIADYITAVVDSNFSLIRYAESLALSVSDFSKIEKTLDSPLFELFLKPSLEKIISTTKEPTLFCISIPFAGVLSGALYCAKIIRQNLKENAFISFGGGYVNTELRFLQEKKLFDYCHILDYDRGYGSYFQLLELFYTAQKQNKSIDSIFDGTEFYRIRYKFGDKIIAQNEKNQDFQEKEDFYTKTVLPDYSSIDFALFPRLCDDENPMHRIWSDGAWLKAYLAHGCYWHRCAFCDTSLDYVCSYIKLDAKRLCQNLSEQATKKGIFGVHFTDEASPPMSLVDFALENCKLSKKGNNKLVFWGNIRFEKTFSRDMADLLSYGGLLGVSGGIEIADETGLTCVNKGTTIQDLVACCCALKEAGILVHSYMIFGFWQETPQMLIDSVETLRQLFEAGLLDSAFYHKFVLTRHSTVYGQWKKGLYPDLQIQQENTRFASNSLGFKGENKSQKYTQPLETALNCWMHGKKLSKPVNSWFDFPMPKPTIGKNFIEEKITLYEKRRDSEYAELATGKKFYVWLGGKPFFAKEQNRTTLNWFYMGEEQRIFVLENLDEEQKQNLLILFDNLKPENISENLKLSATEFEKTYNFSIKMQKQIRGIGLCLV